MDLKKAYLQALEAGDTEEVEKILVAAEAQANPRVYIASDYDEALASGNKYLADVMQGLMSRPLEQQAQDDPYGKLMLDLHQAPWYERALVGAGHRSDQLWNGLKDANDALDTMLLPPGANEAPAAKRIEAQADDDATAKYRADIEKNAGIAGILGELAPYYVSGTTLGPIMSEAMSGLINGGRWLAYAGWTNKGKNALKLRNLQRPLYPGMPMQERLANILGMGATGTIEGGVDSERHALTSGAQGLIGGIAGETLRPMLSRKTSRADPQTLDLLQKLKTKYGYEPTPGELTHTASDEVYFANQSHNAVTQDLIQGFQMGQQDSYNRMMADVLGIPWPKKGDNLTKEAFAALDTKLNEGFDAIRKNTYGEFTPEDLHKINMLTRDIHNSSTDPAVKDLAERWRRQIMGMSGPGGGLTATPISDETFKKTMSNLHGVLKRLQEKQNIAIRKSQTPYADYPEAQKLYKAMMEAGTKEAHFLQGKLPFTSTSKAQTLWQQVADHENALSRAMASNASPEELAKLNAKVEAAHAEYGAAEADYNKLITLPPKRTGWAPEADYRQERAIEDAFMRRHNVTREAANRMIREGRRSKALEMSPYYSGFYEPKISTKNAFQDYTEANKIAAQPVLFADDFKKQNVWARARAEDIAKLIKFNMSQTNAGFLTPGHMAILDKHLSTIKGTGIDPAKHAEVYPEGFYEDILTALQPIRAGMNPVNEAGNTIIKGDVVDDLGKEINKTLRDYHKQDKDVYAKMLQPYQDYLRNATKWQEGMSPAEIEHLNQIKKQYAMRNLVMDNRMVLANGQTDLTAIAKWLEGDKHELGMALAGMTAGKGKAPVPEKEILQDLAYLKRYKESLKRSVQTNMGAHAVQVDTLYTPWRVFPSLASGFRTQLYTRGMGPIPAGYPYITGLLNLPNKGTGGFLKINPAAPLSWKNLNTSMGSLMNVQPWFHATEQTQDFGGRAYRNALRLYDKSQELYRNTFGE